MRLVIINDFYPPDVLGGAEITALAIVDHFRNRGNPSFVLTSFVKESNEMGGICRALRPYWLPWAHHSNLAFWTKLPIDLMSFLRANRFIMNVRPHAVLALSIRYISFWTIMACFYMKVPTFFFATDNWLAKRRIESSQPGMLNWIRNTLINRNFHFKKVICPSTHQISQYLAAGFPESQLLMLPHGVDTNLFAPRISGFGPLGNNLLFVGRLYELKGVHLAIKALKNLHELGFSSLTLTIAGEGDLEYTKKLKNLVSELKLSKKVSFLGNVNQTKLPEIINSTSIVLLPSFEESFGIVAIEAMSCAKPLIASNVGGLCEIISNGIDGLLIAPGDPNAIAAAIRFLLENWQLAELLGKNARLTVLRKYSLDGFMSKFEAVLKTASHKATV